MWLSAIIHALFTGLAVFIALEIHGRADRVRSVTGGGLTLKKMAQAWNGLVESEKTEFLPPMNDEEYEKHMMDESGRGELIAKVLGKLPWTSKDKNSQSSDS